MFFNKIGYIKLKTIKTGSSKTHFRSRKKFAQVLKKNQNCTESSWFKKKESKYPGSL